MYTKETLHELEEDIEHYKQQSLELQKSCWHKDRYSNSADRNVRRLRKLKKLLELGLEVETYGQKNFGLVLINKKFVVSLIENNWRLLHKNVWYRHKADVEHFVNNYIRGNKYEADT